MNLRQIKYFLTISECGSFSKASELLHVAQPSLSQHIRNLEEELGVELLARHPRGATPTEAGQLLYKNLRVIMKDLEHAKHIVRTSFQDPSGDVSLGLSTAACRELAVPIIRQAAERFPRISIHLIEAMSGNLDEWINTGRLDIGLLYEHREVDHLHSTELMEEPLVLVQSTRHADKQQDSIRLVDALDMPLVLPDHPHVLRNLLEQYAAKVGVRLKAAINCDSLPGIIRLVRDGYATIFSEFGVSQEVNRGELVCTPIIDPTPTWKLSIVLSSKTVNMRAAEAVFSVTDEIIRTLVKQRAWKARLI